jgi:pimeloyl-ACP methyl ester carboxylesterase
MREAIMLRLPRALYRPLVGKALYGIKVPAEAVAQDIAMLKKDKFTPRGVAAQSAGVAEFTMTLEDATRINVPKLVQHGTADPGVPLIAGEQIAQTIPGARLSAIPDAGHNYLISDIDRVNR